MKVNSVKELYLYISSGNDFESIENKGLCEVISNEVFDDDDLQEFITDELGAEIEYEDEEIIIFDDCFSVTVPIMSINNRHGSDLGEETILMFDAIKETE